MEDEDKPEEPLTDSLDEDEEEPSESLERQSPTLDAHWDAEGIVIPSKGPFETAR